MHDATRAFALTVFAALAVFGAGCGSGIDALLLPTDVHAQSAAKTFFVAQVYPAVQFTCAFCHAASDNPVHAPQWMGFDAEASYVNVEAYEGLIAAPDNSKLLLKGEHTGPALTPGAAKLMRHWLELEAQERGITMAKPTEAPKPEGPPAITADEALTQFGKCMTYDDFQSSRAYELAFQQTTGWGPCRGCHNSGFAGAFIDDDATLMFEQNRKKPFLLKLAAYVTEKGEFKDIVAANRFRDKGTEVCTYTGADKVLCHPKYVLIPEVQDGIDTFFNATYSHWKQTKGACDGSDGAGGGGGGGI